MNLPNKLTLFRIFLVPLIVLVWLFPYAQFGITLPLINIGPITIPLLNLIVSGLKLGITIIVTIIPLFIRLLPMFVELIPRTLLPFVIVVFCIFVIKFVISHGKGKGGASSAGESSKSSEKGE